MAAQVVRIYRSLKPELLLFRRGGEQGSISLVSWLNLWVPAVTILVNPAMARWIYTRNRDVSGSLWFVKVLLLVCDWMEAFVGMLLAGHSDLEWWLYVFSKKFLGASVAVWAIFAAKYARMDFHTHWLGKVAFGFVPASLAASVFLRPVEQIFLRRSNLPHGPGQLRRHRSRRRQRSRASRSVCRFRGRPL